MILNQKNYFQIKLTDGTVVLLIESCNPIKCVHNGWKNEMSLILNSMHHQVVNLSKFLFSSLKVAYFGIYLTVSKRLKANF